jgi:hypothetical protein
VKDKHVVSVHCVVTNTDNYVAHTVFTEAALRTVLPGSTNGLRGFHCHGACVDATQQYPARAYWRGVLGLAMLRCVN